MSIRDVSIIGNHVQIIPCQWEPTPSEALQIAERIERALQLQLTPQNKETLLHMQEQALNRFVTKLDHEERGLFRFVMNLYTNDPEKIRALHLAAARGHVRAVEILSTNKAIINIANKDGYTPLYIAGLNNQKSVVEILLAAGSEVNVIGSNERIPFYEIIRKCHEEIVELLINAQVDIEIGDGVNSTALWHAIGEGKMRIVKLLVEAGANIDVKDCLGFTPIQNVIAVDPEIVEYLIQKNSNLDLLHERTGASTLMMAAYYKDEATGAKIIELNWNNKLNSFV